MDQGDTPLSTTINEVVTKLARTLRDELQRMMLGLLASLITLVLLTVTAIACIIAGVMRLSDALGRVCGQWLGDAAWGEAIVGVAFLSVPLAGILFLRWRARR